MVCKVKKKRINESVITESMGIFKLTFSRLLPWYLIPSCACNLGFKLRPPTPGMVHRQYEIGTPTRHIAVKTSPSRCVIFRGWTSTGGAAYITERQKLHFNYCVDIIISWPFCLCKIRHKKSLLLLVK